jgi:hypothetical protein|tara:strand:- start:7472 stop:8338 length:867 start_codon:yes stop_codon:yes gene_type:complete
VRRIKYHGGEQIEVDALHFYGCSYVAGQELLDSEIPDPMQISDKEMALQPGEKQADYYRRRLQRELQWIKKIKLEKQQAWPAHMCEVLKVMCFNHASHGSSMTQMKANIVQHIMEDKYDKETEAIVVGLTAIDREMVWASEENQVNGSGRIGMARSMVVALNYERAGYQDFSRTYIQLKTDFHNLWNYMHELWNIINICEMNGVRVYFVPMLYPFNLTWYSKSYDIDIINPEYHEQLQFLESKIDKYVLEGMKVDPLGANIISQLPRGHPCAESHKRYGVKVGNKLAL